MNGYPSRRRRTYEYKDQSDYDSYSPLLEERGFFIPGNQDVGCYYCNASLEYGSNLTAAGIYANSGVLTLSELTSGANGGFRVFGPQSLLNQKASGSYIMEMTANVTAPAGTADLMGGIGGSSGAVSLRVQSSGGMFLRFVSTSNQTRNSSASSSQTGSEKHFAVAYDGSLGMCYLYADGVELVTLDVSDYDRAGNDIAAIGYGCAHGSASNRTPACQIRRLGFVGWSGSLPQQWKAIIASMNSAKSGNTPWVWG